jgi:hypothetical protein
MKTFGNTQSTIYDTQEVPAASLERTKRLKRTAQILGAAVATSAGIAVLVVTANANKNHEPNNTPAAKDEAAIELAYAAHDTAALEALGVTQLQGGVEVKDGSNVRTTPEVVESEGDGETNLSQDWSAISKESSTAVMLASPLKYTNQNNESWYGASDPVTGKFYWVRGDQIDTTGQKEVSVDAEQPSTIYETTLDLDA